MYLNEYPYVQQVKILAKIADLSVNLSNFPVLTMIYALDRNSKLALKIWCSFDPLKIVKINKV